MISSPSKENQGLKAREIKPSQENNNLSIKDKQRNTGQYVLCTDPTTLCSTLGQDSMKTPVISTIHAKLLKTRCYQELQSLLMENQGLAQCQ